MGEGGAVPAPIIVGSGFMGFTSSGRAGVGVGSQPFIIGGSGVLAPLLTFSWE